ncbi:uncharacterized protein KD926_005086 [Aspergillus affinis]|uniref:uncharacterized protein n=1 Tax=Aspergillus affinis TaxID=1070780 RepID=UPI0022FDEB6D|nr:uncharacterized protein KD926_005086 [Aspergillus affinis]KAI9042756.1 hypothetical protein KD926_005086 [Aspergillus affinis]
MTLPARCLWEQAAFALRPIGKTSTMLIVQFFWMPAPYTDKYYVPINRRPSLIPRHNSSHTGGMLVNPSTGEIITSGTIIKLETSDPKKLPLPSIEMLELQWTLHRIAALRGVTNLDKEEEEEEEEDDDDDEDDESCSDDDD